MESHNKYAKIGLKALRRAAFKVAEDARRNHYKIPIWRDGHIVHEIPEVTKEQIDSECYDQGGDLFIMGDWRAPESVTYKFRNENYRQSTPAPHEGLTPPLGPLGPLMSLFAGYISRGYCAGSMGRNLFEEDIIIMRKRKKVKYIHEAHYVAEVEVELLEDETGWSPYISMNDAFKLDDVRDALRRGDLKGAAQYGQIYELRRVAGQ